MVEFSMYYNIFLKSWKTKENLDRFRQKAYGPGPAGTSLSSLLVPHREDQL